MTFAKAQVYKEDKLDNDARLYCTTPGCNKKWSVNMGSPKCSFHQWGKVKDLVVKGEVPKPTAPVDMDAWWQK